MNQNNIPDNSKFQRSLNNREGKDVPIKHENGEIEIMRQEYFPAKDYTLEQVIRWVERNVDNSNEIAQISASGFGGRARTSRTEDIAWEMRNSTFKPDFLELLYDKVTGKDVDLTDEEIYGEDFDEYEDEYDDEYDPSDMGDIEGGPEFELSDSLYYQTLSITDQYRPRIISMGVNDNVLSSFVGVTNYTVTIRSMPSTRM